MLTLKNAKELEFPIVALAGFGEGSYPLVPLLAGEVERDEIGAVVPPRKVLSMETVRLPTHVNAWKSVELSTAGCAIRA